MVKHPWGLPEGSIRALLVLVVTVTACVLFALGRPVPDLLAKLTEQAFLAYFVTRGVQWQAPDRGPAPPDPKEAPDPPAPAEPAVPAA